MRLLLLFLLLAACTSDRSEPTVAVADDPSTAETPDGVPPQRPLRLADLATVCAGEGAERAAPYHADPSEPPRLLVLVRDSTEAVYRSETSEVYFREWGIPGSGGYPDTEVVACLTGFPGDLVRTCEFSTS